MSALVLPAHYRRGLGRPRIELAPPRPLWRGATPPICGAALRVCFETAICDRFGRIERVLQRGHNTITNWGMDQLASTPVSTLINYLVLSSTNDARKRVLSGPTLTVTYTSPTNIAVASTAGFFEAADAGRTLKLPNVPELRIITYTDTQNVVCRTPSGDWLPGFTAPGVPTNYTVATIYYVDVSTLATWFTQFNTYDTSAADYNTEITDATNSQFNHQRIYLSAAVTGADWTINQLGWSDGNAPHNCFGIVNLAAPDTVAIGKKYRVKLNVYSVYTPIDLTGVTVDWGATIGTYTMDLRSVFIGKDSDGGSGSIIQPHRGAGGEYTGGAKFRTDGVAMPAIYWQGQSGGTDPTGWTGTSSAGSFALGSYTTGTYKRTKNVKWGDSVAITAATFVYLFNSTYGRPALVFKPQTGTVTKPTGYWCDWTFPVYWTRDLPT